MIRSVLISIFTYIVLQFILEVPLGYSFIPYLGKITISMIIAGSMGFIDYLYRSSIPSESWKPWDVFALVMIALLLCYGYMYLSEYPFLIIFFIVLSLLTYYSMKIIHRILMRDSWESQHDLVQASRNQFAIAIVVAFMFIPVSLVLSYQDDSSVNNFQAVQSPFNQSESRETLIREYLVIRYPDTQTFNQWSQQRKVELFQDIEFIEANVAHRLPAKVVFTEMEQQSIASFNFEENLIKVNSYYLDKHTLAEWIETMLHEGRHSYQFQLIIQVNWKNPIVKNSPYFSDLHEIYGNFSDYSTSSEDDFDKYYDQYIEIDARKFSEEILPIYKQWFENP
jgi:hypothetical protein